MRRRLSNRRLPFLSLLLGENHMRLVDGAEGGI
jgi:hypothetical protein